MGEDNEGGRDGDRPPEPSPSLLDVEAGDGQEQQPTADELRTMANRLFSEGDYDSALPLYSLAVERSLAEDDKNEGDDGDAAAEDGGGDGGAARIPPVVLHLCNRSACLFKMGRIDEARDDAAEAFRSSGERHAKAAFRLAKCQIELESYQDAIDTVHTCLKKSSNDAVDDDGDGSVGGGIPEVQRKELRRLEALARKRLADGGVDESGAKDSEKAGVLKSVKGDDVKKPSIKDFELGDEIGVGNFSRVVVCRHKTTGEEFALKIIDKKKAETLAKRQHPNVYNEINMERRVLGERLPRHPLIIPMYHTFQDYNSLYFLMELLTHGGSGGELWGKLMYKNKLVGCHPSLVRFYLAELVEALEHMHAHGIVHRDLKAENILLSPTGHVVVIDFGTAKDLVETDLNGPEFVGTPDFMAPEAVKGSDKKLPDGEGAGVSADMWALGVVATQMYCGVPCFQAQSPYLTFLKIQRGNLCRPPALGGDDDAWDLITKLVRVDPSERMELGEVKGHPFFTRGEDAKKAGGGAVEDAAAVYGGEIRLDIGELHKRRAMRVPCLKDLCIRACAELVRMDSLDFEVTDPGDGSSHDMLRLNDSDRARVMHVLDRLKLLGEPRVYRRFFRTKQEAKLGRARQGTVDYVGLTENEQGPAAIREEQKAEELKIVHLTNPLFCADVASGCTEEERGQWTKDLKDCIRVVNRTRPKVVVASGRIDEKCLKLLAKISETIPLVVNDGSAFFSFWHSGMQFLVLRGGELSGPDGGGSMSEGEGEGDNSDDANEQNTWLSQELEQITMSQRQTMAFVECDVGELPRKALLKLMKAKTACVIGCSYENFQTKCLLEAKGEDGGHGSDEDSDSDTDMGGKELEGRKVSTVTGRLKMISIGEEYQWKAEDLWSTPHNAP